MATNFDKALYTTPTNTQPMGEMDDAPALEIEIENPDAVRVLADGVEITLEPEPETDEDFDANLAEFMEEDELAKVADDIIECIEGDLQARKDWVDTLVKGLDVLGLKYEERTEPWNGACGVFSTLLSEAAIRFQSETIIETFPAAGPVKTKIIGEINRQTERVAERVRDDMNYQLTDRMVEYRAEHERLLFSLGLSGSAFKKVYYDPTLGRQVSIFVPAEDVIVPYGASSMDTAERVTHILRKTKNELRRLQYDGFYRDIELGDPLSTPTDLDKRKAETSGTQIVTDTRYQLYEVHCDYDLPGYEETDKDGEPTGIALPYVITIEKTSRKVLAIRRNWLDEDKLKLKRLHFVHYIYVPGFGFYGLGLIHIIGGYAKAGTSLIRQLVDAGTLSNLPGGLKSRGLRVKGDDTPIGPGEFRDVDIPSGAIKDNIMALPYKEPSATLLQLLNQIVEEGRRLAAMNDIKVSDMSAQAPVGTTLALLERQLKTMSAVQARVHYSMKQEFSLLKAIIRDYTPAEYDYVPSGEEKQVKQSDYDLVEVIPVSDPNASTMAQRITQYQAALQLAQGAPQIYDLPMLHRQMLEVLGIKNADQIVKTSDDQTPRDPVSENMGMLTGQPLKAFIYQDHQAHISAHMSFTQDPMTAQMMGQNPLAQQMQAAAMAHIAEHLGFLYRQQLQERLGAELPPPNEPLPPQIEVQLSRLIAQAGQQLLGAHQQQAQQQQAQQLAQDPIVQMQQKELEIKASEVQRKAQKDQLDAQAAQQEAARKAQKDQLDAQFAQQELALDAQQEAEKLAIERLKVGVNAQTEAARSRTQTIHHREKLRADVLKARDKPTNPRG